VGGRDQAGEFFTLDHHNAVGVGQHEISGLHAYATALDGVADAATDVLGRAIGVGAHREDGEVHLIDFEAVSYRTVHNHAGNAQLTAGGHHDGAHQGRGLVALAVDHQHVAGLGQGNGRVDHQVVTGAHFHRQGGAGDFHARAQGLDAAVHGSAAPGHVGQDGGLEVSGFLDQFGGDAFEVADDVLAHGVVLVCNGKNLETFSRP